MVIGDDDDAEIDMKFVLMNFTFLSAKRIEIIMKIYGFLSRSNIYGFI